MLKSNSQQKSTRRPHPPPARGGGTERSRRHSLGWGPARRPWEQSEGDFFKLWESEGKINRPECTAGGSQNKGTEKLQRTAAPSPLEVGGRGRGKGQTQPQRSHPPPPTPSHPANRPRFPTGGACWGRGGKRRSAPVERAPSLWLPGQDTASAPHTQRHLPAEPRPPRSRTELN